MSSKYNIKCMSKGDFFTKGQFLEEIFVTQDGKAWPCCHYNGAYIDPNKTITVNGIKHSLYDDEYMTQLFKDDPDWNNCNVKSIDDILDHDFFTKHISEENWKSDNPPPMCKSFCNYKQIDK